MRVYLHSLVRRLLYSHLTPSTLSSPSLPPSSVLQCTPILTLPLLLPHRSMGEYVWCYDQCMSAACPGKALGPCLPLSAGQLRLGGAVVRRRLEKRPHLRRKSELRLRKGTVHTHLNTHTHTHTLVVWISVVDNLGLPCCTKHQNIHISRGNILSFDWI